MNRRLQYAIVWIIFAATLAAWMEPRPCQAQLKSNLKSQQAWTLDEAMSQLKFYPQDVYLQYVALQLAKRQNRLEEIVRRALRASNPRQTMTAIRASSFATSRV